jgi:hypothetical protein
MNDEYDFFESMGIILEGHSNADFDDDEILYDDNSFGDSIESYDP